MRPQHRHASLIGGVRRSSSGSLAKFPAIRRASSLMSRLVAKRALRRIAVIEITERLPGRVFDDEALRVLIAALRHAGIGTIITAEFR
jgi:hypothetical protein